MSQRPRGRPLSQSSAISDSQSDLLRQLQTKLRNQRNELNRKHDFLIAQKENELRVHYKGEMKKMEDEWNKNWRKHTEKAEILREKTKKDIERLQINHSKEIEHLREELKFWYENTIAEKSGQITKLQKVLKSQKQMSQKELEKTKRQLMLERDNQIIR